MVPNKFISTLTLIYPKLQLTLNKWLKTTEFYTLILEMTPDLLNTTSSINY